MNSLTTTVHRQVAGTHNSWSLESHPDQERAGLVQRVPIQVSIESDGASGSHLILSPEGFFTADTWHSSLAEAKATALDSLGITDDMWTPAH